MVTPSLRIGDTQRRAVDSRQQAAVGDGILTLTEYDERSRDTWGARTQADLDAVVADLPPAAMTASTAGAPAGRGARTARPPESATAVLGTTVVLVPVGVRVEANGMSLLGSREEHIAGAVAGAPTIRVRALGVLGSVEIGRHARPAPPPAGPRAGRRRLGGRRRGGRQRPAA